MSSTRYLWKFVSDHALYARQIWAGWIAATTELAIEMFFDSIGLLSVRVIDTNVTC
jgi:hypothetical protein